MNIISNAFKYTKNGGEISIDCREKDNRVILHICDNGLGIKTDDVNHIFERYYQGENSTQGGTGIGLALAKAVIDQHKGRIWVESTYTKGTDFYVELLLGKDHFDNDKVKIQPKSITVTTSKTTEMSELGEHISLDLLSEDEKPVVLVVDDNIEMLTYLEESLSNYFTVITAVNGELAWKLSLIHI